MFRIKKSFSVLFIFSTLLFSLAAQEKKINLFTCGKPDISAQWGLSFPAKRDLRNPSPSEDFIIAADFHELKVDSGIKYQCNQLDLTNRILYMPTFFDYFQAGFGFYWHFYRYFDEFTENDLTVTTRFRWIKGPVFSFEHAIGFLFKYTTIDAINEFKPLIYNFSYQNEFLFNWHILNCTDLWMALNLQDYFDYPLAISPFFKFGVNYAARQDAILGVDFTLKFIDMFFSAVYLNEAVLRFTFKVVI